MRIRGVLEPGRAEGGWPAHSLRTSVRLISWVPAAVGAAVVALVCVTGDRASSQPYAPVMIVEALVPLIAGMQAAFVFSPDDEPGLEVLLACPRRLAWTVAERLAVLLAWQGGAALLGGLAVSALLGTSVLAGVARWLPPLLLLSAVGLMVTVATRQAVFSVALTLLGWFGMLSNADASGGGLLRRWPYLWPIHVYLQPGHAHYALNRVLLLAAGLALMALAATYLLRDEERVLLGTRSRSAARRTGGA
jgi:hypothetical protein